MSAARFVGAGRIGSFGTGSGLRFTRFGTAGGAAGLALVVIESFR
jgi:hypothetical protein